MWCRPLNSTKEVVAARASNARTSKIFDSEREERERNPLENL